MARAYFQKHRAERASYAAARNRIPEIRALRSSYEAERIRNPEVRARKRERDRSRLRKNKDKRAARDAKRQAAKDQRTPPWLSKEHKNEILSFYQEAKRRTDETGIPHHVDHIVPLRGKRVSGLHVPWNLQVLKASENMSKGNRFSVENNS